MQGATGMPIQFSTDLSQLHAALRRDAANSATASTGPAPSPVLDRLRVNDPRPTPTSAVDLAANRLQLLCTNRDAAKAELTRFDTITIEALVEFRATVRARYNSPKLARLPDGDPDIRRSYDFGLNKIKQLTVGLIHKETEIAQIEGMIADAEEGLKKAQEAARPIGPAEIWEAEQAAALR
jgi:hypothetical protein